MGSSKRWLPTLAALLCAGGLASVPARATSLEITPVAIHLGSTQKATTIEVMNRGGMAAAIQLRAFAWTQAGDRDVLTPTSDIILSPPIFTIAKGAKQTIRLMLRTAVPGAGERTYRLLIDEVPPTSARDQQIVIAMRVSVPLVIAPAAARPRALRWSARHGPGDQIVLSAANSSNAVDRVEAVAVTLADGSHPRVVRAAANPYILAGAERRWVVEGGGRGARQLRLSATTQGGKTEQILALDP